MATLDEGTSSVLTHVNLRHTGWTNLMLAHATLCLCYRKGFQRNNTLPFPCVGEKVPCPHCVSQATTMVDISANPEVTEYLPINVDEFLPITDRQLLQVGLRGNPLFINEFSIVQT